MKVVQTEVNETEHQLLREISEEKNIPIKELVKRAIYRYINRVKIDADDPLFSSPSAKEGATNGSEKHDKYLYGSEQ